MKEGNTDDKSPNFSYKADRKLHAQERKAAKYRRNEFVRIVLFGLENQTDMKECPDMERRQTSMCEVLDRVEKRGEDTILSLICYLLSDNRTEDIKRVTEDVAYRNRLLAEMSEAKI